MNDNNKISTKELDVLSKEELITMIKNQSELIAELSTVLSATTSYLPGMMLTCDIGKCKRCGTATSSGRLTYCEDCMRIVIREVLAKTRKLNQ